MRGTRLVGRRRAAAVLALGLVTMPASALVGSAPALADTTSLPGTLSTAAQDTSAFAVHVPAGVEVRAITGVVTMAAVVDGGTITFRVNGAVRRTVPSALYQKVRIPVDPADVIADGTIGLTVTTEGPVVPGATCVPAGGVASVRKLELDHRGTEVPPTAVSDFFPASSSGITVVIPENANAQMITAGLTAVGALAHRYDDDTPVNLSLTAPAAETATASQRVVALTTGDADGVTTAVSTTSGIPMLTLTGEGDALVAAARALSTELLGLSGSGAQDPSQETKPRNTDRTRTLADLGVDDLALTGYGSVSQQLELRQDSFGEPVSSMDLHLEGSHTAFAEASGARLDVRVNGDIVGSTVLGSEATFTLDADVPSSRLRSVNDVDLVLNAVAPDGSACTPPSIQAAEVDLDAGSSSVTVTHGTGRAEGFQLYPQIFRGVLPVALRSTEGRQASAAINAAALVAVLQRAAGSLLEIQLMQPDAFLADDRSGLMVGALSADSEALDAPLKLSSTRLIDQDDATTEVTSQDPYAVLESVDRNDRLVLMLGSWAPEGKAAPGELARKVVAAVVASGWDRLDGDLVIADEANPTFVAGSRSLAPHTTTAETEDEEESQVKWFVIAIAALLLLLAIQLVGVIRRDRRLARDRDEDWDDVQDPGPAYVEDDDEDREYEVDELGDVDDLQVHEYAAEPPGRADLEVEAKGGYEYQLDEEPAASDDDTGELPVVAEDPDDQDDPDDPGLEPEPEPAPEPEDGADEDEASAEDEWQDPVTPVDPAEPEESEEAVEPEPGPEPEPEPEEAPEPAPKPTVPKPPTKPRQGRQPRNRNRRR